jgi:cytochrome c oxidase subunit 3
MGSTVTTENRRKNLGGGNEPMGASYGKLMMWFYRIWCLNVLCVFLRLWSRFKFIETWPPDEVFTHFPFMHGVSAPMYYVALMTFILIFSSVTMVLRWCGSSNEKR